MNRSRLAFLVLFALLISACGGGGSSSDDSALRGGACDVLGLSTRSGDVTSLTRIIDGDGCSGLSAVMRIRITTAAGESRLCTGLAIAPQAVLTAGHCFFDPILSVSVDTGITTRTSPRVVVHPNLAISEENLAVINDAAIIFLSQPLDTPTLPLLVSSAPKAGDIISIFGFGLDEDGNLGQLQSGEMRLSSVTTNHLFAPFNGAGSNTCGGDSGGPAIIDTANGPTIAGLVSTGRNPSCAEGDTTLFTNIQAPEVLSFVFEQVPEAQGL